MEHDIEYMWQNPPRCLGRGLKPAEPVLRSLLQKQYGTHITVFSPVCECGNGDIGLSTAGYCGPTSVHCLACGRSRIVFNPLQHGYDGEVGNNAGVEPEETRPYLCEKCGHGIFRVAAAFQYMDEAAILEQTDLAAKPQDLFGWFALAVQCTSCQQVCLVVDQECA